MRLLGFKLSAVIELKTVHYRSGVKNIHAFQYKSHWNKQSEHKIKQLLYINCKNTRILFVINSAFNCFITDNTRSIRLHTTKATTTTAAAEAETAHF